VGALGAPVVPEVGAPEAGSLGTPEAGAGCRPAGPRRGRGALPAP